MERLWIVKCKCRRICQPLPVRAIGMASALLKANRLLESAGLVGWYAVQAKELS